MAKRRIVEGETYSGVSMTPEILQNRCFINCSFIHCYFGNERGLGGHISFLHLNTRFSGCSFEYTNFKGVARENFARIFKGCAGLATARNFPEAFRKVVKHAPLPVSDRLRQEYEGQLGVTHGVITAPRTQYRITDLFARRPDAQQAASSDLRARLPSAGL